MAVNTSVRGTTIVYAVNRTTEPLDCMDDGVPIVVRPGYKRVPLLDDEGKPKKDKKTGEPLFEVVGAGENGQVLMEPLPYFTAERCRRQHPLMGSEDPNSVNDAEFLIAVPEWGQDYSHLEQSDAPERINRALLPPDAQKATLIAPRGGRKAVKPGKSNARRGIAEYTDPQLQQPVTFGR